MLANYGGRMQQSRDLYRQLEREYSQRVPYAFECRSGFTKCRGIVTGKDWQREDLQQKYHGMFSWYLQQKIEGIRAGKE